MEQPRPKLWNDMYIELLANPVDNKTDKEFCEELGLSVSALQQWKKKYRKEIYNEVQKRRTQYINELRAQAYKALGMKMQKDTNALKMVLQITGDLVERTESKVEMTDAEKLRRIRTLRDGFTKREEAWKNAGLSEDSASDAGPRPQSQELGGPEQGPVNQRDGEPGV
jgi:hypothetical protein